MDIEPEEIDCPQDSYYAVISVKDKKGRFYDGHSWGGKKELEKYINSHQELNPILHNGWEFKDNYCCQNIVSTKLDDLCKPLIKNLNDGIISADQIKKIEELPKDINKLPDEL